MWCYSCTYRRYLHGVYWNHSYSIPLLDLPAHAIHGGAQGSIYFNPPLACSTRTAHWQAPKQLLSRERTFTATYALDLRSKGRSVRIPKRISAAAHLCGGNALVNMSAA